MMKGVLTAGLGLATLVGLGHWCLGGFDPSTRSALEIVMRSEKTGFADLVGEPVKYIDNGGIEYSSTFTFPGADACFIDKIPDVPSRFWCQLPSTTDSVVIPSNELAVEPVLIKMGGWSPNGDGSYTSKSGISLTFHSGYDFQGGAWMSLGASS